MFSTVGPPRLRVRASTATIVTAMVLVGVLAGCKPRHAPGSTAFGSAPPTASPSVGSSPLTTPTPTATTTPSATSSPTPLRTVHTTLPPRPLGDLTIHLAGGCTWYRDSLDELWLNPTLGATWTGPAPFPSNGFSMTANYGKRTAGGPVTSAAPFTWAIGGEATAGNSFLGHTVKLTVTIDAVHTVAETNETNNTTIVTVLVPSTPPPASGTEVAVGCT